MRQLNQQLKKNIDLFFSEALLLFDGPPLGVHWSTSDDGFYVSGCGHSQVATPPGLLGSGSSTRKQEGVP